MPVLVAVLATSLPAGTSPGDFAAEVARRQRTSVRTRHTWRRLRRGAGDADAFAHARLMSRTYAEIAARSGARVIVDTSKIPGEAALLPFLDGVAPYFVHLVRDPRAVAESWREPKQYVYAMSASKSTWYWYGFNLATRAITRRYQDRSLFLRHEDFIADPAGTIDRLLALVGAGQAANPVRGRVVELHPNHTVTGNPDRFLTGPTVLRDADDRWMTSLSRRARLAAAICRLALVPALRLPLPWDPGRRAVRPSSLPIAVLARRRPRNPRSPGGTTPGTPRGACPETTPAPAATSTRGRSG